MKALIDIKADGLDVSFNRYGNDTAIAYISYRGGDVSYVYEIDARSSTIVVSHITPKEGVTFEQAYGIHCVHSYNPCPSINVTLWYDLSSSTLYITDNIKDNERN